VKSPADLGTAIAEKLGKKSKTKKSLAKTAQRVNKTAKKKSKKDGNKK